MKTASALCLSGALMLLLVVAAVSAATTEEVFNQKCAMCHGKDGKGQTPMGKKLKLRDLTDAKVQAAAKDAEWEKILADGVKSPEGKSLMPGYKDKMKPEELKELLKYSRGFKGK